MVLEGAIRAVEGEEISGLYLALGATCHNTDLPGKMYSPVL